MAGTQETTPDCHFPIRELDQPTTETTNTFIDLAQPTYGKLYTLPQ